jgi:hypothetical protein
VHEPRWVIVVADQIRNIVYHRNFRVDDRVSTADAAHRQVTYGERIADLNRLPRGAELRGGLGIGVQGRRRVGLE